MLDWLIKRYCNPDRERRGNCYFAFLLYMKHGGNIIITKSAGHPIIPHIAWTDELPPTRVRHFIPLVRQKGWKAIFYSPWFNGKWEVRVIKGKQAADGTLDSGRNRR